MRNAFRYTISVVHVCLFLTVARGQVNYAPGNGHTLADLALREIDQTKAVGTLPGVHGVSGVGAATYSVPVAVPPGTNGMAPTLGFQYGSNGTNGVMGLGWTLSGPSAIVRTGRNNYHDGVVAAADFSANDRFMLDGQRLVCVSGVYGAVGSAYDTEQAAFSTSTLMSAGGTNAAFYWFKVITKQGMTLEYGSDWNSKVLNDEGDAVVAWRLNRAIDPFGNYIVYDYEEGANSLLSSVRYTGNSNTGLQPYNRVDLTYTDGRTDVLTRYGPGTSMQQDRLLTSVTVKAEGELVRRYDLSYAWRDNKASYLNEVNMVDADGSASYNATQFAYGDVPATALTETATGINPPSEYDLFTGDFDGNGRSDIVIADII